MIWFITRRFLGLILTLWIVFTISFILMRAVPGGPYSSERNLPPEIEENIKEKYRLNLSPTVFRSNFNLFLMRNLKTIGDI